MNTCTLLLVTPFVVIPGVTRSYLSPFGEFSVFNTLFFKYNFDVKLDRMLLLNEVKMTQLIKVTGVSSDL